MERDERWMPLVELFDPLPQKLADLIQRGDEREVYFWVDRRLRTSQRDIEEFRATHRRLDQLLDASAHPPKEPPDLVRYHEDREKLAGVTLLWFKRLLAAQGIGRDFWEVPND